MPETLVLEEFGYGLGPEAITYELLWETFAADACPRCQHLNGATWTLKTLTGTLSHPSEGDIYDLDADLSLTHPNCRCFLLITPQIDLEKTELFQAMKNVFEEVKMDMPSNIQEATQQVDKLRANFGQARGEFREFEYILYRTMSLINRMGLPPNIEQGIQKLERMIMTIRILHSSMVLFEIGTPYGWILGLISGITAAISISDLMLSSP